MNIEDADLLVFKNDTTYKYAYNPNNKKYKCVRKVLKRG